VASLLSPEDEQSSASTLPGILFSSLLFSSLLFSSLLFSSLLFSSLSLSLSSLLSLFSSLLSLLFSPSLKTAVFFIICLFAPR